MSGDKKKKTLGRDAFDDRKDVTQSDTLRKLIKGRSAPEAREVTVSVKLTPSNLKHLDAIRARLAAEGRTDVSRNDLIRIAISLLTAEDVN